MKTLAVVTVLVCVAHVACAADWPRFRGPGGLGIGATAVPLEWSDEKNLRWRTPLPGPGSSSPAVHGDLVIVNASEESPSIRDLDRRTGREVWKSEAAALELASGTPSIATVPGGGAELVVVDGDVVYVFGGFRSAGSFAVRAGGRGDVTKSHVLWTSRVSSYVATPLLHDGHLSWIDDRGQAHCARAASGTPAVVDGCLFHRSGRFLACIGASAATEAAA